jgi:hypothetical protein
MTRATLWFLALLVACGCAGTSNGPESPAETLTPLGSVKPAKKASAEPAAKVEFASCKAHLDAIADCFFKVVTQIQREPKEGEPMAAFLGKATWQIAASPVHEACSPLGLDDKSKRILLADGSEVRVQTKELSHDQLTGGAAAWLIEYRFSSPTCAESGKATIELRVGEPADRIE